jgi:hypothetical protein
MTVPGRWLGEHGTVADSLVPPIPAGADGACYGGQGAGAKDSRRPAEEDRRESATLLRLPSA